MIQSSFVTALKNMHTQKFYSIINIGGLAIGLTACMMIFLYVIDELSYDNWIPDAERIERLEMVMEFPGREPLMLAKVYPAMGPALADYFKDEIECTTRALQSRTVVRSEEIMFKETVTYVDADFFRVFQFPMVTGDEQALNKGKTFIYLNESMAEKYFGDSDPVGRTLSVVDGGDVIAYEVAGVFADIPPNSHMPFQIIALLDPTLVSGVNEQWNSAWMDATYVKFHDTKGKGIVFDRLNEFMIARAPVRGEEHNNSDGTGTRFNFINVQDVHLYSDKTMHLKPNGSITTVISFTVAAFLILVIASINFMNLSTAHALRRAKEVSLRKVMGAKRSQLIKQFLGEAVITVWIALLIALILLEVSLPFYNAFLGKSFESILMADPGVIVAIVGMSTMVGLLGGIYPAFFLSSYRPSQVLSSSSSGNKGSHRVRQFLVVFQFAISITLIITTTVMYLQTSMMRNMDRGYNSEHRLALNGIDSEQVAPYAMVLRQNLLGIPGVKAAGFSSQDIPMTYHNNYPFSVPSEDPDSYINTDRVYVDQHFFEVYDIKPIAGRLYSEDFSADFLRVPEEPGEPLTSSVIVTESFVNKAGFSTPAEAIGDYVSLPQLGENGEPWHATIVGVVGDMELRNIHEGTSETAFFAHEDSASGRFEVLTLSIQSSDLQETLGAIDAIWRDILPEMPISRYFVDDSFNALYNAEQKQAEVFATFSVFGIFVACLGLFGLAAFAAEQRTKEIGIRKVLGAQILDILKLLNWQFVKSVLLANLIAWPLAYFLMNNWLQKFAVRIDLGLLLFLGAGVITLLVAVLTVSSQAYRVARAAPIHALRTE
jgi:putative ABC transport system permease protein